MCIEQVYSLIVFLSLSHLIKSHTLWQSFSTKQLLLLSEKVEEKDVLKCIFHEWPHISKNPVVNCSLQHVSLLGLWHRHMFCSNIYSYIYIYIYIYIYTLPLANVWSQWVKQTEQIDRLVDIQLELYNFTNYNVKNFGAPGKKFVLNHQLTYKVCIARIC